MGCMVLELDRLTPAMASGEESYSAAAKLPVRTRFARRLKEMRCGAGMSVEELAFTSGLTFSHIQAIENEQVETSLELLASLAAGLGLSVSSLLETV